MLVLTRKKDDGIVINTSDGSIEICIVNIKGNQVRVGLNCAKDIKIYRKELLKGV